MKRKEKQKSTPDMRLPTSTLTFGLLLTAGGVACAVAAIKSLWWLIPAAALAAVGILLCIVWRNYKIEILSDSAFAYTSPWGKRHEYAFSDITDIKITSNGIKIIVGDDEIFMSFYAHESELLSNKIDDVIERLPCNDEDLEYIERADMHLDCNIGAYIVFFLAVAAVATVFAVTGVYYRIIPAIIAAGTVAVILVCVAAVAFLQWKNQTIKILSEDTFEYTTLLGHSAEYRFSDITGIQDGIESQTVFVGEKKIHIEKGSYMSARLTMKLLDVSKALSESSQRSPSPDVRPHGFVLFGGIALLAVGIGFAVGGAYILNTETASALELTAILTFSAISLCALAAGVFLCIKWKRFRITMLSNDEFECVKTFGKKKVYRFSDIEDIMYSQDSTRIFIGGEVLAFSRTSHPSTRFKTAVEHTANAMTFDSRRNPRPDVYPLAYDLLPPIILAACAVTATILSGHLIHEDAIEAISTIMLIVISSAFAVVEFLKWKNCRITMLNEKEFQYTNLRGQKKVYLIKDITKVYGGRNMEISVGKRKLRLSGMSVFSARFAKRIKRFITLPRDWPY